MFSDSYYAVRGGDGGTTFKSGSPTLYAGCVQDRHLKTIKWVYADGQVKTQRRSTVVGTSLAQYRNWTTSAD